MSADALLDDNGEPKESETLDPSTGMTSSALAKQLASFGVAPVDARTKKRQAEPCCSRHVLALPGRYAYTLGAATAAWWRKEKVTPSLRLPDFWYAGLDNVGSLGGVIVTLLVVNNCQFTAEGTDNSNTKLFNVDKTLLLTLEAVIFCVGCVVTLMGRHLRYTHEIKPWKEYTERMRAHLQLNTRAFHTHNAAGAPKSFDPRTARDLTIYRKVLPPRKGNQLAKLSVKPPAQLTKRSSKAMNQALELAHGNLIKPPIDADSRLLTMTHVYARLMQGIINAYKTILFYIAADTIVSSWDGCRDQGPLFWLCTVLGFGIGCTMINNDQDRRMAKLRTRARHYHKQLTAQHEFATDSPAAPRKKRLAYCARLMTHYKDFSAWWKEKQEAPKFHIPDAVSCVVEAAGGYGASYLLLWAAYKCNFKQGAVFDNKHVLMIEAAILAAMIAASIASRTYRYCIQIAPLKQHLHKLNGMIRDNGIHLPLSDGRSREAHIEHLTQLPTVPYCSLQTCRLYSKVQQIALQALLAIPYYAAIYVLTENNAWHGCITSHWVNMLPITYFALRGAFTDSVLDLQVKAILAEIKVAAKQIRESRPTRLEHFPHLLTIPSDYKRGANHKAPATSSTGGDAKPVATQPAGQSSAEGTQRDSSRTGRRSSRAPSRRRPHGLSHSDASHVGITLFPPIPHTSSHRHPASLAPPTR